MPMLSGKKIILGISGGIAAYKSLLLIRLFKKAGAGVRVVCTSNALEFITRVSLESLSGNKVYHQVFGSGNDYTTEHVSLTDWGDVFVLAPATANIIGKLSGGIADDALSTSLLAFDKQLFIAPAMNCKMWSHYSVKKNLEYLKKQGVYIIGPAGGYLACGYEGQGRMEEAGEIFRIVSEHFSTGGQSLSGKQILVTAGPTHEAIDPVRYLGNRSSGKMGFALARELASRGASVHLVAGPTSVEAPAHQNIHLVRVVSARDMLGSCIQLFPVCDAAIMAAAVADYTPSKAADQKIKKDREGAPLELTLLPTTDILGEMGKNKKGQVLAGFALEPANGEENARKKLAEKNLDFIVLNSLEDKGAGFLHNTNKVAIIGNNQEILRYELKDKQEVAADIADTLEKYLKR